MDQQQARVLMEPTQPHHDTPVVRATAHECNEDDDEYGENEPVPDLEKDDMMARRTGSHQKNSATRTNQSISRFLPVPGSVKYTVSPVSVMKPLSSRQKLIEKMANERCVWMKMLTCWWSAKLMKHILVAKMQLVCRQGCSHY